METYILTEEKKSCSSDMLTVLNNLELMFYSCRNCINESASRALMIAMAIEAETLALKMQSMLNRWKNYLPFQEAIDVRFEDWMTKVEEWIDVLDYVAGDAVARKYPWFMADSTFMIDLYALLPEADEEKTPDGKEPFYQISGKKDFQLETADYMQRVDDLLENMEMSDMVEGWRTDIGNYATHNLCDRFINVRCIPFGQEYTQKLKERIEEQFATIRSFEDANACCVLALGNLQNALIDLQSLFDKSLSNDMFIRLSTRLFYRHCLKDYQDAERQVTKWRNTWPEARVKANSKKRKEELKKQLLGNRWGEALSEYLDFDEPNLFGDASFGKFLFQGRHDLKKEDIQTIHRICREIILLNELAGDVPKSEVINSASMRKLSEQEQQILNKLMALVKKGNWVKTNEESIASGLSRALGVGQVLPNQELNELSEQLWGLLKHRRGCDADKSLMVAWLNIVGYCVKRGFLSGGSPALCKQFFPKCHSDDYKAIDKGKSDDVKSFTAISPLLDLCLR